MPELPEVETVVRDLRPLLTGRTITAVRQSKRKLRRPWLPQWNAAVSGARVEGLRRRGKWILIDVAMSSSSPLAGEGGGRFRPSGEGALSDRETAKLNGLDRLPLTRLEDSPPSPARGEGKTRPALRVHLGMSGQFTVVPMAHPEPDHLHVVFALDNEHELRLRDPRRFGSAEYFPDRDALATAMNADLGPEPFGIDAEYFRAAVRGTKRTLKAILLDQTIVAGVGNIYADEACFRAKLHPGRSGKELSADECDRLRAAIEAVMTRAIESRGSTIRDYVGGSGLRGGFQNEFAVYGKTGEPCPACQTAIAVGRHSGRASHYCPSCQGSGVRGQASGKKAKGKKAARAPDKRS